MTAIAEGPHTGVTTFTAASADLVYAALAPAIVTANITDNDNASVLVTESAASTDVAEGGANDSYDVVLTSQPLVDVVITLAPDAQVVASTTTLTFTPLDWATPQTVTVGAVDDAIAEGLHTGTITHTAAAAGDPNYDLAVIAPVVANIADNDAAAIIVTESGGSTDVAEGGATDSYDVVLGSEPTADVTITLTPDSQLSTDVTTLTFTPLDWNVAQTVTVTAVDDSVVEGLHTGVVTHAVASADPMYAVAIIGDVTASITDNDAAGVNIDPVDTEVDVSEAGVTDTYQVSLTAQPLADVTITLSARHAGHH